jgi:hypothetical protein
MAASAPLTDRALGRATLARQGLIEPIRERADAAVGRLGSLQAQHPEWPPVALASRAAAPETADLAGALERRAVVRSSLMRITIHVVHADDLWPMFEVMQPMRLDQWRLLLKLDPRSSRLGRRLLAAHEVAIGALRERPRSSLELDRLMAAAARLDAREEPRQSGGAQAGTVIPRTAWRHFAAFVPLVHVPHDREGYGRSLYALAEDWLGGERPTIDIAEARAHVARVYLRAFGPASVDDLAAYVGRARGGIGPWRAAIDALREELVELHGADGRRLYDLVDAPRPPADSDVPPRLLARWDSVLLSHGPRARGRILDDAARAAVFTRNADVRPSFLVDGVVAGTWELSRRDGDARITLSPLADLTVGVRDALAAEAERVLAIVAPEHVRSVEFAP